MRPLELDFHRGPRPNALGWGLLTAGFAMLAGLAGIHYALDRDTSRQQARLQTLEIRLAQVAPPESASTNDTATLTAARLVLVRAGRPWRSLFDTLEAADDKDIAVLSITPDATRGQVKIYAEARHLTAMLAYQQRLQTDASLRQVTLLDHELVREGAETPVRFHISASWGDSRVGP